MRKQLIYLAAASLAAGTFGFLGSTSLRADQPYGGAGGSAAVGTNGARATGNFTLPQGINRSDQADTQGIRRTLGQATDAVFSNDPNGLTNYLVPNDQTRLSNFYKSGDKLSSAIDQFKKDWKAKYGQDFDISGKEEVVYGPQFQGFDIVQGEVTNPALLSNWPVEPGASGTTGANEPHAKAGGPGEPDVNVTPHTGGGTAGTMNRNLERGQNVAMVTFPAEHGASETTVCLTQIGGTTGGGASGNTTGGMSGTAGGTSGAAGATGTGGGASMNMASTNWRIDVPDSLSSDGLRDNLAKHITEFDNMKAQWPADPNEAYRLASHHIFMALYDTGGMTTGGGMGTH